MKQTLHFLLRSLTVQGFAITVLPLTLLLLFISFSSVFRHQQDMRSLVGERDERAVQSALFILANPALASMMNTPLPTHEVLWAAVNIPKPTATPVNVSTPTPLISEAEAEPSTPTETPALIMQIVKEYDPSIQPQPMEDGRWIDVNLSQQQIYIYEGDALVNTFIVSTGLPDTPTVTGEYRIYVKVPIQDMSGPGYYLPDVPWVMYFYDEYGFHGTYWHNSFGTPMSRGCVNLRVEDAAWLYDWASIGTGVRVHY